MRKLSLFLFLFLFSITGFAQDKMPDFSTVTTASTTFIEDIFQERGIALNANQLAKIAKASDTFYQDAWDYRIEKKTAIESNSIYMKSGKEMFTKRRTNMETILGERAYQVFVQQERKILIYENQLIQELLNN